MNPVGSDNLSLPSGAGNRDEESSVFFCYAGGKPELIPRNVTHIQVDPCVEGLQYGTFQGLLHLVEICFENTSADGGGGDSNVRRMGPRVFFSCPALTRIVIPQLVRSISNSTFSRCESLTHVTFPLGLVEIGSDAFHGCVSLGEVQLPSTLLRIGPSAFKGCRRLQKVDLPLSLMEIEFAAFHECISLQMIAIPPLVKTIVNNTFDHCLGLKMVRLSEGVRIIDTYAFRFCVTLKSIAIPASMYKIGRGAFADCRALETVEFAEGNLRILNGLVFADCTNLFHLGLPSTIVTLYRNSFEGCTGLEQLPLPDPNEDLTDSLTKRFEDLPVHKLCYMNIHGTVSETLQKLQGINDSSSLAANKTYDFLGMSPFHILAASSRPDPSLFEKLLPKYPEKLWNHQDLAKATPMSYLLRNPAPESTASIRHIVHAILQHRVAALGLEQWRMEVDDMIDSSSSAHASERLKLFEQMLQHFRLLEEKEASSILEQAVWKVRASEMPVESAEWNKEEYKDFRESCRINCGAEIVIPNVLLFLGEQMIGIFGF